MWIRTAISCILFNKDTYFGCLSLSSVFSVSVTSSILTSSTSSFLINSGFDSSGMESSLSSRRDITMSHRNHETHTLFIERLRNVFRMLRLNGEELLLILHGKSLQDVHSLSHNASNPHPPFLSYSICIPHIREAQQCRESREEAFQSPSAHSSIRGARPAWNRYCT